MRFKRGHGEAILGTFRKSAFDNFRSLFPKTPFSVRLDVQRDTMVGMFPVPPIVYVVFVLLYCASGLAIGAACGRLVSFASRSHRSKTLHDSSLGLLGFWIGFFGAIYMPWHENTVTERLAVGGIETTTMNSYQHPVRIAIVVAALLPILYEIYRFRRARKQRSTSATVTSRT
jgi:hypothetical protein